MRALPTLTTIVAVTALVGVGCTANKTERDVERDEDGAVVDGGEVGAFRLQVGDCFVEPESESEVEAVDAVNCDQEHMYEVYDSITIDLGDDADFPGITEIQELAGDLCLEGFEAFVGVPYETSIYDIAYLYPTQVTWDALDDREVVCLIAHYDGTMKTGSANGTAE